MKTFKYILKKHIPERGFPLINEFYDECHRFATKQEIKKYGIHKFHKIGILIPQHPHELLGTNKPSRRTYVSEIVPEKPEWEREEVGYHEDQEALCIERKIKAKRRRQNK
jgi:hypothetical protein